MDNFELLEREYRTKKCSYEEKQDKLFSIRDKGLHDLDELADCTQYYLKNYVPDYEIISDAFHRIEKKKDDVREVSQENIRQIERQLDDLEDNYYKDVRKLTIEEETKKEGVQKC